MRLSVRIICLLFVIFVSADNFAQSIDCQKKQCLAVIDAGSSGSRIHVYSYDLGETNTPENISEKWSKRIKPGFATIQDNQASIDAYLTTLFAGAPENNLPVIFYATAGMRLLPHHQQQQRYEYLKNWFHNHSQWTLVDSRTITGNEEGMFDWLAINYQLGNLNGNNKTPAGVMDIGGASVQIVFPVMNNTPKSNDVKDISIYGKHFRLFIHSFLGLGQNEVTHQFLTNNSCFITDYKLPDGLNASGDAYHCERGISPLINSVHHVNQIVHPMIEASSVSEWVAIGGVADLVESKPFSFPDFQFTNEELLAQADAEACHQQWSNLYNLYPDNDYLYGYCLLPSYYYALMVDGYGLEPNMPIHLMKDNKTADWTMGVVLQQK